MNIFKKWQAKKHRKEVEAAMNKYNGAVETLADAAEQLGKALQDAGLMTDSALKAITGMQELTEKALISPNDLQRGGTGNGKR